MVTQKRTINWSTRTIVVAMLGVAVCVSVSSTGCVNPIRRGQSPDQSFAKLSAKKDESQTKFVGDVCGVKGLRPVRVEGIGLVVGLDGTGSNPGPSEQKDYLLRELKARKSTGSAKEALKSPNTSMVLVRALIPAAARKGDKIDVEVSTVPKSDTRSLKFGNLLSSDLRPVAAAGKAVRFGHIAARTKGLVLVDSMFESREEEATLLSGRILGGATVKEDRELTLIVNSEETSVKLARSIAHSINQRYSATTADRRENVAHPVTDRVIELQIPKRYEHNLGRFIQALQAMSYGEKVEDRLARLDELERKIVDPTLARRAAIELEAIGEEAVPALERALKNPDFEVRFHVAEALAYLGETAGIPHLKLAAESEPAFRWHALTALASIDKPNARDTLTSLFNVQSAETRYGAFRAIKASQGNRGSMSGTLLADDFYLHEVDSKVDGMIHFSRTKQPEIVIFGNDQAVASNFMFVEPGLTIRAINSERIQITRFDPVEGKTNFSCSTRASDLIRTMARMGADYTTILEMFREADSGGTLAGRLVINAAPKIGSKSMSDSVNSESERSEKYIAAPAPELFSDIDDSTTRANAER